MKLLDGIIANDLMVYLQKFDTIIISDIHLGYEESFNRRGVFVPRNSYLDLLSRLKRFLERFKRSQRRFVT